MSPVVISLTCLGRPMQCRLPPAGGQDKPSLSAWPSPVVPQGQHVTLQCRSHHKFDTFRMYKDNGILVSKLHSVMSQKGFLIGPVTPTQAGTYRCCGPCPGSSSVWSAPSDPLVIVVSMNSPRAIKVEYGIQVIKQVTLSRYLSRRRHHGGSHANFSMGPATAAHGGTCRCFSSFNRSFHEWSAPSDPLDIMITGLHQKPSLWAQPGAVVRSGENVTFSCCSESSFDVYQLSRDEQPHECWLAKGQRRGGESQADFPLGPAHSALGGTYRCHGSFNRSPCEWSGPSDPLYISITGEEPLSSSASPISSQQLEVSGSQGPRDSGEGSQGLPGAQCEMTRSVSGLKMVSSTSPPLSWKGPFIPVRGNLTEKPWVWVLAKTPSSSVILGLLPSLSDPQTLQ
uniref:Killer cell immunoglobulin-like receptor 3DL3 n=1 Tax=Ailuropoda melanoleuca TaxID=9646 RepID=A0A7N5KQK5_AILME